MKETNKAKATVRQQFVIEQSYWHYVNTLGPNLAWKGVVDTATNSILFSDNHLKASSMEK